jgi:nitrate/TMAO reductase-like tetraheme cytochrome c subunit
MHSVCVVFLVVVMPLRQLEDIDMEEWQSGVRVEKCDKFNYPHYCDNASNATVATKQEKEKQDVCKDCHKEHPYSRPNCKIV